MTRGRPVPWAGPLGLYHPGTTALHRAGAGMKLIGLAVFGMVTVALTGPTSALALVALAVALAATARLPVRPTAHGAVPVLLTAGLVGAYQWWARGWPVALEVSADLLSIVLVAVVVTATTRSDRMLDALARAARPLRHVGLPPETVALAIGLMLRTIPALVLTISEVRDAASARGLERSPRALLVPGAVRTVARARATGDALAARGLAD